MLTEGVGMDSCKGLGASPGLLPPLGGGTIEASSPCQGGARADCQPGPVSVSAAWGE